jgi:hypothetical protein
MGYVWVVILLGRLAWYLVRKGKAGRAPAAASLRVTNLALLLYIGFVYFFFFFAAFDIAMSDLSTGDKWIAVPLVLVSGIYIIVMLPHWLAWRVCGPWRLVRLGRLFLVLATDRKAGDRRGSRELYQACFGHDWDRRLPPSSPWTLAAAALQAEAEGDAERADLLLAALRRLPPKTRVPRRARAIAAEGLAAAAARRGEWQRAAERAAGGKGRGVWFLRRAAAAHLGRPGAPFSLLATWALAPGRIAALPLLRGALEAARSTAQSQLTAEAAAIAVEPAIDLAAGGPHLAHLHLLSRVAAGRIVRTGEVLALAEAWAAELTAAQGAELVRRGLELGGQELTDLPVKVGGAIGAELDLLAEAAEGAWSGEGEIAGHLARRRIDAAFAPVQEEIAAFRQAAPGKPSRHMTFPLEELERWLTFRARVEQLERVGGEGALATAWHNGLRITACNWPVFLTREQGVDALWAAYLMHRWSADLATRLGDDEIATLSGQNAAGIKNRLP